MSRVLGTMFTFTTYGTWLRGDRRGWVDDGVVFPPDPWLEAADRNRMKHPVFLFDHADLRRLGCFIGQSLRERLGLRIHALAVRVWHAHVVVGATEWSVDRVAKCAKDAVRWGLRAGRPIWTAGYDKRFCYDERSLFARIEYVERHNVEMGLKAKPWDFIESPL